MAEPAAPPAPADQGSIFGLLAMILEAANEQGVLGRQQVGGVMEEFQQAVREGTVAEFMARHPELTPDDFMALYRTISDMPVAGQDDTRWAPAGVGPDPGSLPEGYDIRNDPEGRIPLTPTTPNALTPAEVAAAQAGITQAASARDYQIVPEQISPYDLVLQFITQSGLLADPNSEGAAQTNNALTAQILQNMLRYNPELQGMDYIPAGYAVDEGFMSDMYQWKQGDTVETVAADLGIDPNQLRNTLAQARIDPNTLLPGQKIPLPPVPPGRPRNQMAAQASSQTGGVGESILAGRPRSGMMESAAITLGGEQTNPENPAIKSTTPTGSTSTPTTTATGDVTIPEVNWAQQSPAVILEHLLSGQSLEPSRRADLIGQSGQFQAIANLLAASGGLGDVVADVDPLGAYKQAMGTSADEVHQMMLSFLGQNPNEMSALDPGYGYMSSPTDQMNALAALMSMQLGGMAGAFMGEGGMSGLMAAATEQAMAEGKTVTQVLQENGWI